MKNLKLFLLLLTLPFVALKAQTRSEIQTQIETIATGVPNTALKIRTVLATLANGTAQTGDVKEIDVSTSYIDANFDPTGLGINERLGWAICNGNNGTRDRRGRVPMQYSTTYPTLGATGGSADAIIPAHSHQMSSIMGRFPATLGAGGGGNVLGATNKQTEITGESGVGKNMQPYIVTLMIMKL